MKIENLKKISFLILTLFVLMGTNLAVGATKSWNFNNPSNYFLSDSSKAEIDSGVAKVKDYLSLNQIGVYNTSIVPSDVILDEARNVAYVADGSNGVRVIDIFTRQPLC